MVAALAAACGNSGGGGPVSDGGAGDGGGTGDGGTAPDARRSRVPSTTLDT
ncbi:MAG: hypothetical protein R2939_12490 [Kofleriaceae bacterium]